MDDALHEVNRITRLFICNHFNEALNEVDKKLDQHFFFQVLNGLFRSIQGVVTFQDETLSEAMKALHSGLTVVNIYRRKRSRLSRLLWSPDFDDYTDLECQAEGCYSVLSSITSVMSILHEKSLVGLVKAGYWGKTAFDVLK